MVLPQTPLPRPILSRIVPLSLCGTYTPLLLSSGTNSSTTSSNVPGVCTYPMLNPSKSATRTHSSKKSATVLAEPTGTGPAPPIEVCFPIFLGVDSGISGLW
ncbi:hypothetical protein VN97_g4843 [Penicillium thymicola]|uniref:Uncharacterized protein n=1 Tax=Penicillium thymicola TaxID=293382 RepID=A0AAI9TJS0_PENTH|nr:hypothetical protein VN97_g4843 [Penicillium thymicola]